MKSKSCHLIKTMLAMDAKSSTLQGIGTVVGQPKNSSYETEIDLFYLQCVNILSETILKIILV